MGIAYKNKVTISHSEREDMLSEELSNTIFSEMSDEFYEFTGKRFGGLSGSWHQRNGFEKEYFVSLSKKYENILFFIQSARVEDFGFRSDDISYHWFLNGSHSFSVCEIHSLFSPADIDRFVKGHTKHHCVYDRFVSQNGTIWVMACNCGNQTKLIKG